MIRFSYKIYIYNKEEKKNCTLCVNILSSFSLSVVAAAEFAGISVNRLFLYISLIFIYLVLQRCYFSIERDVTTDVLDCSASKPFD